MQTPRHTTHIVWLLTAVLSPHVGIVGVSSPVAVLNPSHGCISFVRVDFFFKKKLPTGQGVPSSSVPKNHSVSNCGDDHPDAWLCEYTSSKVQRKERLRPKHLAPLQELVRAELVRFDLLPRKIRPISTTTTKHTQRQRLINGQSGESNLFPHLERRWSFGPTPSSQWYVATKLPPGYRTTGISSSLSASSTSFRKPFSSDSEFPGS